MYRCNCQQLHVYSRYWNVNGNQCGSVQSNASVILMITKCTEFLSKKTVRSDDTYETPHITKSEWTSCKGWKLLRDFLYQRTNVLVLYDSNYQWFIYGRRYYSRMFKLLRFKYFFPHEVARLDSVCTETGSLKEPLTHICFIWTSLLSPLGQNTFPTMHFLSLSCQCWRIVLLLF